MNTSGFRGALLNRLFSSLRGYHADNEDRVRFPTGGRSLKAKLEERARSLLLELAAKAGFAYLKPRHLDRISAGLDRILENCGQYDQVYSALATDRCRFLLIELLIYRLLGREFVKLSTNTPEYWQSVERVLWLEKQTATTSLHGPGGFRLSRFDLEPLGHHMRLYAHPLNVLNTFVLEQYAYRNAADPVCVEPDDVVIDGGSCWGDTALYFAEKAGPGGRVFGFEFVPDNLRILDENVSLNAALKGRVTTIPQALWSASGQTLTYQMEGPASRIRANGNGASGVGTTSIDDFVRSQGLGRVNFIKLDIEGSEMDALRGAAGTIREYRPKLAIAVYHKDDDLWSVPAFLREVCPSYSFYLAHFTIHREETVLFAAPQPVAG